MLSTPDKFIERIEHIVVQLGITRKVRALLIQRLEKATSQDITDLSVSAFVKVINVSEAVILHDKNDKVIPIERAKNVCTNWDVCKLIEVEGTGHFRILRNSAILEKILQFLKS